MAEQAAAELHSFASSAGDPEKRAEQYRGWIVEKASQGNVDALRCLVPHVCDEGSHGGGNVQLSKQVLSAWATIVLDAGGVEGAEPRLSNADMISLGTEALDMLSSKQAAYQECTHLLRERLSTVYQAAGEWAGAVRALKGISLDHPCVVERGAGYRVELFVQIARLYLELGDFHAADEWANKAWPLMGPSTEERLQLLFNACFARVYDGKGKFLEAGRKYYELSFMVSGPDEVRQALCNASVCATLSGAGPQRSRLLGMLVKDDRSAAVLGPVHSVLVKMYLDRILRPEDVAELRPHLQRHHEAPTADGTVLEKALVEHNLRSASILYYNISFAELGTLLHISSQRAEKVAAVMIREGRLNGKLDQVSSTLVFESGTSAFNQWDHHIKLCCNAVNTLCDSIVTRHPQYKTML
eukprot:Rhum_TRINITY_DN15752_c0_g1::Rhum_TRINITY_DN15752_c0_g1_i1::g.162015::m.162015/K12178/COPS4, CSN4; COP9 signalosome complex subunit 4